MQTRIAQTDQEAQASRHHRHLRQPDRIEAHGANFQDRDGAPGILAGLRREAPQPRHMFADGGCAGPKLRRAFVRLTLQIVKRSGTGTNVGPIRSKTLARIRPVLDLTIERAF